MLHWLSLCWDHLPIWVSQSETPSLHYTKLFTLASAGFKNVYYKEVDQASLSHPRLPGAEVLACYQKLWAWWEHVWIQSNFPPCDSTSSSIFLSGSCFSVVLQTYMCEGPKFGRQNSRACQWLKFSCASCYMVLILPPASGKAAGHKILKTYRVRVMTYGAYAKFVHVNSLCGVSGGNICRYI